MQNFEDPPVDPELLLSHKEQAWGGCLQPLSLLITMTTTSRSEQEVIGTEGRGRLPLGVLVPREAAGSHLLLLAHLDGGVSGHPHTPEDISGWSEAKGGPQMGGMGFETGTVFQILKIRKIGVKIWISSFSLKRRKT